MKKSKFNGWLRVLLIIIPYIITVTIFQNIGASATGSDMATIEASGTSFQLLILRFFDGLGTFVVLWLFMKYVDREKLVQLGFQFNQKRRKEFLIGLGIGTLIMTIGYFLLIILQEIHFSNLYFNGKELLIIIGIHAIVSVVEEALYRGYLLRNLMNSFNKYAALVFSSGIFAVLHAISPNAGILSTSIIFLAGIMLGLSYVYTRNLWFPIGLHFGWNVFQTLYGFNVSGKDAYSLVEFTIREATILNGGNFGFERTILAVIAALLVIVFIWFYFSSERKLEEG